MLYQKNRSIYTYNYYCYYNLLVFYTKSILSISLFLPYYSNLFVANITPQVLSFFSFINKSSFFRLKVLSECTVVDNLRTAYRFFICYSFLSITLNVRLNVLKLFTENMMLVSLCSLYKASNWLEREAYDMFGCWFFNHPDLRRILTDYGFSGYPLRKDFSVVGCYDLYFIEKEKNLVYYKVRLKQASKNSQQYQSFW